MSPNIQKVLVTGASGFLGSVIVDKLLAAGYNVRGTARSGKAPRLQAAYESFKDRFEVAVIDDLATSDLSEAFKSVQAVIHVGSPLAGQLLPDLLIKTAVDGTTHVLDAAVKAGVTKIVVTSSTISIADVKDQHTPKTFDTSSWNSETLESAIEGGPLAVYGVAKTLAEKALWEFAAAHPELDVATVHPAFLYGRSGRGHVVDAPASGTNWFIYQLISGPAGRPVPPQAAPPASTHVLDAAVLHVLALKAPPSPASKPKRILAVGTDSSFTWLQAVQWLYEARPELVPRLPKISGDEKQSLDEWCRFDVTSAKEIVGFEKFKNWQETVKDAIDGILEKEKELGITPAQ